MVALTVAACTGTDPSLVDGAQDGGGSLDGGNPSGTGDGGCIPVCDGDFLRACETRTECALGCSADGTAHCKVVVPSGLLASTTVPAGLLAAKLQDLTVFDTTNGKIDRRGATPALVRDGNVDPARAELVGDIGFELLLDPVTGKQMAVWSFASLDLASGATVRFLGSYPVAFVVGGTTTLRGVVDLHAFDGNGVCSGAQAGPGGLPGGISGEGAGGGSTAESGAGGGGHCSTGGPGGGPKPGLGGRASFAISGASVPRGGGGGGNAGGGGGGGAIQIVAPAIVIGGGAGPGGIDAGGCGGKPGTGGPGGGGGAGGTILLEAGTVTVETNGHLSAMGGGGAAGNGIAGGAAELLDPGGGGGSGAGAGGSGGKGSGAGDLVGGRGVADTGSGGGGVGLIRVRVTRAPSTPFPGAAFLPTHGATECADVTGLVTTR